MQAFAVWNPNIARIYRGNNSLNKRVESNWLILSVFKAVFRLWSNKNVSIHDRDILIAMSMEAELLYDKLSFGN